MLVLLRSSSYEFQLGDILIADLFLNDPSDKTRIYCMHPWADSGISSSWGQHQDLKSHSSSERNKLFISIKHIKTEQKVC